MSYTQKQQISPVSSVSTLPPPPSRAITLDNSNRKDIKKLSQLDLNLPNSESSLESQVAYNTTTTNDDFESSDGRYEEGEIQSDDEDDDEGFVEFDLGGDKTGIISNKVKNNSTAELIKYGKGNKTTSSINVSSTNGKTKATTKIPSVDNTPTKKNNNSIDDVLLSSDSEDDDDSENDADWRQMNTELDLDMYNEKGELITNSDIFLQDNKEQLEDGSKLGYTRIAAEEQVTKFNKMNEEFEFLFNNKNNDKLHNKNNMIGDDKIYFNIDDDRNHNSKEDLSLQNDEELSTLSQLKSTKEMLKESQKIAYVGLVKLIIVEMAINLSKISINNKSIKLNKKISMAHANFQQWSIKMMDRLYDHMELNEKERQMIETLSSHGLEPNDLIPSLITIETLNNPLLNKQQDETTQFIKKDEDDELSNEVLKIDIKWTLICDLFLNLIFDAVYDSRSRNLILKFGEFLGISNLEIYQFERRITDLLEIEESSEQIWNEQEILDFRAKSNRKKKLVYIGLATLGGSLVIGLSAGLLAPVIGAGVAAGLTTIGITGTSGFLAGVGGTSIVTTVGVLSGATIGSKGMAKRVGNVKTFEFRPIHNNRRVNLILTVSGWMNSTEDDVRLPFSTVDPVMGDIYSLLWEPEMLKSTGQTINILATEILTNSIQQILGSTVLIAFFASAQWPLMLTKLGYLIDNPWSVSLDRAWAAGIILADTLVQRNLGVRPVTLVGFSLGARLIYSCLLELNKRGAYGLIQDVILFGSPLVFKHDEISLCKTVVSGHFVNGYSKRDWILGYLFRATSGGLGTVAGLTAIEGVEGVENFDCTEFVNGHMEYRKQIPKLLKEMNWEVLNEEFVEIDEPENIERQRELIHEFENVKDEHDSKQGKGKKNIFTKWFKPKKKEWWEVYEEGRKEVEAKQKQNEEDAAVTGGDNEEESSSPNEELFNVDEIAKEVAKLEVMIDKDKTPIMQQTAEFQPRSFKTKSVESTPIEDFVPRPFKSPKSNNNNNNNNNSNNNNNNNNSNNNNNNSGVSNDSTRKQKTLSSSKFLQNIVLADDDVKSNDGKDVDVDNHVKEPVENKNTSEPPKKSYSSYFDDDDEEFNNTGQEIKMSFA